MRDEIGAAVKEALKSGDKKRLSTLRMMQAAIQERDIQNRGAAKPAAGPDEVSALLTKMIKSREEAAKAFEGGGRPELAQGEREEIAVIRGFLPEPLGETETQAAIRAAIADAGATSPKDMGKVIALLKERHAGRLDMSRASGTIKEMLK
ncbi:MAG TPA: GatB/YqeY domain-containing protein [Mesorhizobium sp.]|nr:GatB/YqeY domain-containing protein [Mesorhizobium sp.]